MCISCGLLCIGCEPGFFQPLKNIKMATAGYSGTPLLKKLGITPNLKILLINAPMDYTELLQVDINEQLCKDKEIPDLVHLFTEKNNLFEKKMRELLPVIKKNPKIVIWVSWYKKSAKKETDITEDVIRNYALRNNLVDIKVCAVSELWSGLKLVVPVAKRI